MKKPLTFILALTVCLSLAACSRESSSTGKTSLPICLASEPTTLDPALSSSADSATIISHLFSGLARWTPDSNGNALITADAAETLVDGIVNADGTVTYTYTLRDNMTWSDGKNVTAADFAFAWKRAASTELAADYGYMFEVIAGYPDELSVTARDKNTLEVTLASAVPYWNELLAFPTFFPVREDVLNKENWTADPKTCISNGAYTLTSWNPGSTIVLEKNPNYIDSDTIKLDKLECFFSPDSSYALSKFERGEWLLIDDVPFKEIETLKTDYPAHFVTTGQGGTYFITWNANQKLLPADSPLTGVAAAAAEAEIRAAINLLLDRNYITDKITQTGQIPASTMVAMGLTEPDGTQFYKASGNHDFIGYYDVSPESFHDNWARAIDILKKYYTWNGEQFTNFPALTYLHSTSDLHNTIGKYLADTFASIGITLHTEEQPWVSFLKTRKAGNFSIARNGLQSDLNDPIFFLDMWVSDSDDNAVQFGREKHADLPMFNLDLTGLGFDTKITGGTWSETYDVLVSTIKDCPDAETRYTLMHMAEDMLMSTGCIMPLYYYTDVYMISDRVNGFFTNPLGRKYFMYCTVDAE